MIDLMMRLQGSASDQTRQHDRTTMARARMAPDVTFEFEVLRSLQEIVEALDRRIPQVERAGEARIAADASRLRAAAIRRIAVLRRHEPDTSVSGTVNTEHSGGANHGRFC